ncbi:MAG TPA: M48 family metallopeptidase, partial [Polyangiales bacterium]|nr:M48 family metallopeptidase [Polyangiales bacterium]
SEHVLYYQLAEFVPLIGGMIGAVTFGVSDLITAALKLALLNWKRLSEFTADRAGLLVTQDVTVAINTMVKLAGLPIKYYERFNPDDFIAQARGFEALDGDMMSLVAKWLSTTGSSHPWTVLRANQFLTWIDSGAYERVLARPGEIPLQLPSGVTRFCARCGRGLGGGEGFCPGCGHQRPNAA